MSFDISPSLFLAQISGFIGMRHEAFARGQIITKCVGGRISYFNKAFGNINGVLCYFNNYTLISYDGFFSSSPIVYHICGLGTAWQVFANGLRSYLTLITKEFEERCTLKASFEMGEPNFEYIPYLNGMPNLRRCENEPFYELIFRNAITTSSQITRYTIISGDCSLDTTVKICP